MSGRFNMNFDNFNKSRVINNNFNSISPYISSVPAPAPKQIGLNGGMINRVYKAKPGCSACGKKVA